MMLTSAQLATLKADLAANTATVVVGGTTFPINSDDVLPTNHTPPSDEAAAKVAAWYNLAASPAYFTVRTDAPVADILNAIVWANFTPAPAITSGNAAQATAASAYCQGKMLNVQTMLFGRSAFDATKATQTGGLKDATTQLPSGAAFANQAGGWPAIVPNLQHAASRAEKLLAVVSTVAALQNVGSARGTQYDGANGNPDVPGTDTAGAAVVALSPQDIKTAWGS